MKKPRWFERLLMGTHARERQVLNEAKKANETIMTRGARDAAFARSSLLDRGGDLHSAMRSNRKVFYLLADRYFHGIARPITAEAEVPRGLALKLITEREKQFRVLRQFPAINQLFEREETRDFSRWAGNLRLLLNGVKILGTPYEVAFVLDGIGRAMKFCRAEWKQPEPRVPIHMQQPHGRRWFYFESTSRGKVIREAGVADQDKAAMQQIAQWIGEKSAAHELNFVSVENDFFMNVIERFM